MTRIDIINPACMFDQHIVSGYREIPRVVTKVRNLLKTKSIEEILKRIPNDYVLGTGHVSYFYDKLLFIKKRHDLLKLEGELRGFNLKAIAIDLEGIPEVFKKDFAPSEKNVILNISRIGEKIVKSPNFYKYYKK